MTERAGQDARWDAYMVQHRLKSTKQRDAIITTFLTTDGHMSIEQLLRLTQERQAGVGYATVYRTLKLLVDAGVAAERRFGDGQTRYEFHSPDEHHDHLICQSCARIVEFHDEELEALQDVIAERYGFSILDHKHEIYGLCSACH
jgi:Fur family ferric uptake transcriptional regulator